MEDLGYAWPIMLGALGFAIVFTIVYILMMRWLAGVMVWASFGAVTVLLIGCNILFSKSKYF